MKNQFPIIAVFSMALCSITSCTDEPKKTDEPVVAVEAKQPMAAPWKMFESAGTDAGAGPVVGISIDFGIKANGNMMECKPGAGICEPPKLGSSKSSSTAQIVNNTLRITVNVNAFKSSNPVFYDSLMKYKMNGFLTFEDGYKFDPTLCAQLGNNTGINIEEGSPFSFSYVDNDSTASEVFNFYGAIPGNSACITFSECNGEAYSTGISFSPVAADCEAKAYTTTYLTGYGSAIVSMVMRTDMVIKLTGGCIPLDTNWQLGYSTQLLTINNEFVFSDPKTAASISVPVGSVLPASTGTASIGFMPTGWCVINLYINLPEGQAAAKK